MGDSVKAELWRLGVIAPWYLYDYQKPVYLHLRETRNPFFEATRRFGKTTTLAVAKCEDCQRIENRTVIWCEPWKEQARNIVIPEINKIANHASSKARPRFYKTDSFFEFPSTGSRIYLVGVNEDRAEGARGRTADDIVLDEYGSFVDADYIENEVLRPLTLTTNGQMTLTGTPPSDLGHLFYDRKQQAIRENRYIGRDFDTVTAIPQAQKDSYIQEMGGRNSTAVRRELYLEPVADPESLVIPEFNEKVHVFETRERPQFYDCYVGIDLGFNDFTAGVFGYYDYLKASLVIEGEVCLNGKNSKEITDAFKEKERSLWYPHLLPDQKLDPYIRVGDNELQQLFDMQNVFGYYVMPTRKDDKLAAVNALRLRFQNSKIAIHKSCVNLIFQIKVGMWNERRTQFVRGEKTGHLDCIDALIYLNRNVEVSKNPFPANLGLNEFTHFIPKEAPFKRKENESLREVFEPFGDIA